jgi:hypothetical protein
MNRKKCLTIAVAAALLVAAAICLYFLAGHHYLTLRDRNGRLYARYRMEEGDSFSISFIHSVNRLPLWDIYEIHEGKIYVEACKYGNFGAGVQSDLNPGEVMSFTEDGFILITGIHQDRSNMRYNIAGISDHMLELPDGTLINLRELCGKGAPVWFNYEYLIF